MEKPKGIAICYELYSLVYTVYVYCAYDIVFGAPCIFLGVGCKVYIEYRTFRRLAWYCGCDRQCPVRSRWGR